jgi:RNA polymerase sigma-70 factor (ECF subfamily)
MAESSSAARFPTTHWSRIARAGDFHEPEARAAIEELCRAYWFPLYAFVRRQGYDADASSDLVQGLFARLLEHHALAAADARRGRFRTFLLAACRNYLADRREHDAAQKRGGGQTCLAIDAADAEGRYQAEPAEVLTPERVYERAWALALLERVLGGLRREYEEEGKGPLFARLEPTLVGGPEAEPYAAIALALGTTEGSVQVNAHRLRRRYRDRVRAEIAATVDDPAEVDDEIRDLFAALAS